MNPLLVALVLVSLMMLIMAPVIALAWMTWIGFEQRATPTEGHP